MKFLSFLANTPDGYPNLFDGVGSDMTEIFGPEFSEFFEELGAAGPAIAIFLGMFFCVFMLLMIAAVVVMYVFQSRGHMRMLRSVGYAHPFFAWIPFVNVKALGDLADMYDSGRYENYGKTLLKYFIITTALSFGSSYVQSIAEILPATMSTSLSAEQVSALSSFFALLSFGIYVVMLVFNIIYMVKLYRAIWCIYRIFAPERATLYLLLSIFVPIAQAIIIFKISKNKPQNVRKNYQFI